MNIPDKIIKQLTALGFRIDDKSISYNSMMAIETPRGVYLVTNWVSPKWEFELYANSFKDAIEYISLEFQLYSKGEKKLRVCRKVVVGEECKFTYTIHTEKPTAVPEPLLEDVFCGIIPSSVLWDFLEDEQGG